jgi:hypothetical protein
LLAAFFNFQKAAVAGRPGGDPASPWFAPSTAWKTANQLNNAKFYPFLWIVT